MARTGRPRKEIDKSSFEKLCALFCTEEDIADFFECSIDTVNRWCKRTYGMTFADIYPKKRAKGKISLRRIQFDIAKKGNATMAIFLGKNYLGQSDKQEYEDVGESKEITINVMAATPEDIESDDEE